MTWSLICACLWAVVANVVAILPSRDARWRAAYVLAAIGVPLVGWLTYENGPWLGLIALAAGASILRWPLRRSGAWIFSRIKAYPWMRGGRRRG